MARSLIVGHLGQDGRLLWEQLSSLGHSLIGIGRESVDSYGVEWPTPCNIDDAEQVRRLIANFLPTHIYFLAAHHHSSQDQISADPTMWRNSWATHVLAFGHILAAAAELTPKAKVFYASSSRIFGSSNGGIVNEDTPPEPEDCYGVTKAAGMKLAEYYRRVHCLPVSCGIMFNHESPLRRPQFVTQRVVRGLVAIQRGESPYLELGSLDARVDWGYAPDYTQAMQAILSIDTPSDYVVATGALHSVRDLVEAAAARIGIEWQTVVRESQSILRRGAQALCGDSSKLRNATGWAPSTNFDDMVTKLVEAELARCN